MITVTLLGRPVRIVPPSRRDPRLKLFAIIVVLQVLGQTLFGFQVSIAQILVTLGTCMVVELAVMLWRDGLLAWPASALQTGNSVAFILRTSGTQHGDWWSLNGIVFFVLAAVIGLGSKYAVRPLGRHVFNPSNLALVATLLVVGPRLVFPQPLWWGPPGLPLGAALAAIVVGAVWLLREPVGMLPMAASFLAPFTALVGLCALAGRSFVAAWHVGPISGLSYWLDICLSPEIYIFVFFMMSDPRTAPASRRARVIFGPVVAVVAAALLMPQSTEFGIKLGILCGLTVTCALSAVTRGISRRGRVPVTSVRLRSVSVRGLVPRLSAATLVVSMIAIAAPVDTLALLRDPQVLQVEQHTISGQ